MAPSSDTSDASVDLAKVTRELQDEAARRRASGELAPGHERELDRRFAALAPLGADGSLADALDEVDRTMFIDPVVPVESSRQAGAAIKKSMRSASLWYVSWLTRQINQFAVATSRSLHLIEQRLEAIDRQLALDHEGAAPVVEFPGLNDSGAWWVDAALSAVSGAPGRVLHAAAGADQWLVKEIRAHGNPADGIDPRLGHGQSVSAHLDHLAPGELGAVILSAVVEGLRAIERTELVARVSSRLAPGGVLVIHSVTPKTWFASEAPAAADLAPGRPLRPQTWRELLEADGYAASLQIGPTGADYLVIARRSRA